MCQGAEITIKGKTKKVDPQCAAALLNVFEYWTNYKIEHSKQAQKHNEIREAGGLEANQDDGLWIWKTTDDLHKDVLEIWGTTKIEHARKWLVEQGLIHQRNNPEYKWDKTYQYKMDIDAVNLRIRKPNNTDAIPMDTTKDTTEKKELSFQDNAANDVATSSDDLSANNDNGMNGSECPTCNQPMFEGAVYLIQQKHDVCIKCYENPNAHTCTSCGEYRMHSGGDGQSVCDECNGSQDTKRKCAYCSKPHWSLVESVEFKVWLCSDCLTELHDIAQKPIMIM
jgi:hypothetical protein